jgi:hypothetical protein
VSCLGPSASFALTDGNSIVNSAVVAGTALYLMGREPDLQFTPQQIKDLLIEFSTKNAIEKKTLPRGTPNRLLFNDVPQVELLETLPVSESEPETEGSVSESESEGSVSEPASESGQR